MNGVPYKCIVDTTPRNLLEGMEDYEMAYFIDMIISRIELANPINCQCNSIVISEVEYLNNKVYNKDWEFRCDECYAVEIMDILKINNRIEWKRLATYFENSYDGFCFGSILCNSDRRCPPCLMYYISEFDWPGFVSLEDLINERSTFNRKLEHYIFSGGKNI